MVLSAPMTLSNTYRAVHQRVRYHRGKASDLPCAAPACDQQAQVWSWDHTGPSQRGMDSGRSVQWGLDVADYSPLCRSHARMIDAGGTFTHCKNGHERTPENTYHNYKGAGCRPCRNGGSL